MDKKCSSVAQAMGGETKMYGKGSHWMSTEVAARRKRQRPTSDSESESEDEGDSDDEGGEAEGEATTLGWLHDTIQLLREFHPLVPAIVASCCRGPLHLRTRIVERIATIVGGFAEYAGKFLAGDLLELLAAAARAGSDLGTLRSRSSFFSKPPAAGSPRTVRVKPRILKG